MIQYVLWGISFISLWIALVWLNVLVLEPNKARPVPKRLPKVTIALPCYNKAHFMEKTVHSLANLNYPKHLLQFIIVDDCSTDKTYSEAKRLKKAYPALDITVLRQPVNTGKAGAMNTALAHANGELFACLDADTRVEPDSLRYAVSNFADPGLGASISRVKVDEPKNLYERLQRVEYISSNFLRSLMSDFGTLAITPGVLSVYKAAVLKKVGGFAEGGLTEDLEIALRLRDRGYDVCMERRALTHTSVPTTWSTLWRQRLRWYRGFFVNHLKYRHMLFNKNKGLYGMFQMPLNVLAVILLMVAVVLVSYGSLSDLYEFLHRSLTIKGYFFNHFLDLPTLKELVLAQNVQVMLPILLVIIMGIYLTYIAHKHLHERIFRHLHYVILFILVAPYVTTIHWISALMSEAFRVRRKW